MEEKIRKEYYEAKNSNDIKKIELLCKKYPNDSFIKLGYAKKLLFGDKNDKRRGKEILEDLLDTPSRNHALLELGITERLSGNYDKAKFYFETLLNEAVSSKDVNCAYTELAKMARKNKNYEEALKYLNELLKCGDNNYVIFELGKIEVERGNYEKAYSYFSKLLNTKSKNLAMFEIARIYTKQLKLESAEKCFNELLESKECTAMDKNYIIFSYAKLLVLKGEFAKSKELLNNIMEDSIKKDKIYAITQIIRLDYFNKDIDGCEKNINILYNDLEKKISAIYYSVIIDIKNKNYEEALNKMLNLLNQDLLIDFKLLLYVLKELNVFIKDELEYDNFDYILFQTNDYDPYVAIEYIIDNYSDMFDKKADLYRLFNYLQTKLTKENKIEKLQYCDTYIVDFKNIGINQEDYIKVFTIPNTKNIVLMYPVNNKYITDIKEGEFDSLIKVKKKK